MNRRNVVVAIAVALLALSFIPAAIAQEQAYATTETDFLLCPSGPPGDFPPSSNSGPAQPPPGCQYGAETGQPPSPVTFCSSADVHAWVHASITTVNPYDSSTQGEIGAGVENGTFQVTVTGPIVFTSTVFIPSNYPNSVGSFDMGVLSPGTYTVTANWLGSIRDAYGVTTHELPSSTSDTLTIVPCITLTSGFVVGDLSAGPGASVTFWGAQWWKDNALSGGTAPADFKGFADTVTGTGTCGSSWTTKPGDSSKPPATVGAVIAVIVSSSITQHGSTISGDVEHIVFVQTNPGYKPDPGHPGTGTIIGVGC